MALQGTNIAASTLDGGINNSVTSLDVASAASFPTSGDFWIRIDDEIMKVTGVSSNTFTVVRGESGGGASAAASHSNGATVLAVLTSQAITQLRADITRWGTHATMAALTDMKSGDVFHFDGSDTPYHYAIYNGSSWDLYYGGHKCTPFVPGDYSWVNQGTASYASVGGATVITCPVANLNVRGLFKAEPSTPYAIKALLYVTNINGLDNGTNSVFSGLAWRESGTSELAVTELRPEQLIFRYWTNTTTAGSAVATLNAHLVQHKAVYLRYERDSGRESAISFDGVTYTVYATTGDTDTLDPDQVGVAVYNNGVNSLLTYTTILSWEES